MNHLLKYRTALTLLLFGVGVLSTMWACDRAARPALVPVVVGALVTLGLGAAGKSAYEKHVEAKAKAQP